MMRPWTPRPRTPRWYQQATDLLLDWQKASRPGVLPPYDEALLRRELHCSPTGTWPSTARSR
jgi:aminoglycoside/choline kinase family phosphotransferase